MLWTETAEVLIQQSKLKSEEVEESRFGRWRENQRADWPEWQVGDHKEPGLPPSGFDRGGKKWQVPAQGENYSLTVLTFLHLCAFMNLSTKFKNNRAKGISKIERNDQTNQTHPQCLQWIVLRIAGGSLHIEASAGACILGRWMRNDKAVTSVVF